MFDALARLAYRRARRVGIVAVPSSSSPARRRLGRQAPGPLRRRRPGDRERAGRQQLRSRLRAPARARPASTTRRSAGPRPGPGSRRSSASSPPRRGRRGHGYYDTRSPAFVSRDGHATYFAVALKPTDDKERQDAGDEIADSSPAGPASSSAASRWPRSRSTSRSRRTCAGRDAGLPAALPALAALLPQPGRGAAAADGRRPGDRRHLPDPAHRQRGRLDLGLRPQPDHRRSGSGWRSTTASSSSPATARRSPRPARAWRRCGAPWRPPGGRSSSPR